MTAEASGSDIVRVVALLAAGLFGSLRWTGHRGTADRRGKAGVFPWDRLGG
jgi:hypothetical protein